MPREHSLVDVIAGLWRRSEKEGFGEGGGGGGGWSENVINVR